MGYDYLAMDYLAVLRNGLASFGALLDGDVDLMTPVEHCGDWTLYDLADHLGGGNLWVATAVAEDRGDYDGPPAPKDLAELRPWFAATTEAILDALSADPETPAWTFSPLAPGRVGFWRRRRAHETSMHLWDARNALGSDPAYPADLAVDGVSEVLEFFTLRMIERGLATEPSVALRLTATDVDASWTYGPGAPVAELAGPATDLLLALWGRASADGGRFSWSGDRAAGERVLAGPLVP